MSKFVCVHGHFYQPPRENPWLESIEPQDSAAPYHDWNERILVECYEPNTASRILGEKDTIASIVNNYSRISFNVGPTLLSWLEASARTVYDAILEADRESRDRYGGHGSALAQAYNHTILPLATNDDKDLQVAWGVRDFERRFGRPPEGMWLAETAVDTDSLEVLAKHGVLFTILAPHQARRVRAMGEAVWHDVGDGAIDPTRPYVQYLPSGRSISIFFYDGPLSRAVAFQRLLDRGGHFAARLVDVLPNDGVPRLSHIATDGESYGHHHPHGDMALAYALNAIETKGLAELTNYGEFLERFPPEHEVQIAEETSWSCAHGVERWRSDCGCHTGGQAGWTQSWRAPLRGALDWLRAQCRPLFDTQGGRLFRAPREALHDYVDVIGDRSEPTVDAFFARHTLEPLGESDTTRALKLLELERQLQLMYTSCGWFFSDLAGIETVQVLQYAGRAVQLAEDLSGERLEVAFLEQLSRARSNRTEAGSGADIYRRQVAPSMVTWEKLSAHYALSSLFESYPETSELYCYDVEREAFESHRTGKTQLAIGNVRLTSRITRASEVLSFAAFHLGDHNSTASVRRGLSADDFRSLVATLSEPFVRADSAGVLRLLDQFGEESYDLKSLFGDEKRLVLDSLLKATLDDAERAHRQLYELHGTTLRFLSELGVPSPPMLAVAASVVLSHDLKRALTEDVPDEARIGSVIREAALEGVALDDDTLAFATRQHLETLAVRCFDRPDDITALEHLRKFVNIVLSLPFEVDLWKVQNLYFQRLTSSDLPDTAPYRELFAALGRELSIDLTEHDP